MKFTTEDLEKLKELVKPFDTEERREAYRTGNFKHASLAQNVDRRYRFDTLWLAADSLGRGSVAKEQLYDVLEGYLDEHINTALKSFIPPLQERIQS